MHDLAAVIAMGVLVVCISRIIHENSVGSKFYENERKKDATVNERIKKLLEQMSQITPEQMDAAYGQVCSIL